jgi:predicted metal-dependent hydrolase
MIFQASETVIHPGFMTQTTDPGIPTLHPRALAGLRLFNDGEYFTAHEELEAAWRAEKGPIRDLYQGILQVGVACYHLERGNYRGALKVIRGSRERLAGFPDEVSGIQLAEVKADAERLQIYLEAGEWDKHPPRMRPIVLNESL